MEIFVTSPFEAAAQFFSISDSDNVAGTHNQKKQTVDEVSDVPGPDLLTQFVGSQHFETAAEAGVWLGFGLTIFGLIASCTGIGATVGVPCFLAGWMLLIVSGFAFEISYETRNPESNDEADEPNKQSMFNTMEQDRFKEGYVKAKFGPSSLFPDEGLWFRSGERGRPGITSQQGMKQCKDDRLGNSTTYNANGWSSLELGTYEWRFPGHADMPW